MMLGEDIVFFSSTFFLFLFFLLCGWKLIHAMLLCVCGEKKVIA